MNKRVKKKWVEALRSGRYKKGTGYLHIHNRFCCLGVLCDLYSKRRRAPKWEGGDSVYEYEGQSYILPACVRKWAGLSLCDPEVRGVKVAGKERATLADMNDNGATFKRIATVIEEQL